MRALYFFFFALAVLSNPSEAVSFDLGLSVGARLEAGLDGPTRELLRFLPAEFRKQFILTLDEALPKLNDSFDLAVSTAEEAMRRSMATAQCKSKDVIDHASNRISGAFSDFFFSVSDSSDDADLGESDPLKLLQQVRRELGKVSSEMKADEISAVYAKVNLLIGQQICVTSGLSESASFNSLREAEEIAEETEVWLLLSKRCGIPQECYAMRHRDVNDLLKKSDQRDVTAGKSLQFFSEIEKPFEKGWLMRRLSGFERKKLEANLISMLRIERSVAVAKAIREDKAQKVIEKLKQLLVSVSKKRLQIKKSPVPFGHQQQAIVQFRSKVKKLVSDAKKLESAALALEPSASKHTHPMIVQLNKDISLALRGR